MAKSSSSSSPTECIFTIAPTSTLSNPKTIQKKKDASTTTASSPFSFTTSNQVYVHPCHCKPGVATSKVLYFGDWVSIQPYSTHPPLLENINQQSFPGYLLTDTQLKEKEIRLSPFLLNSLQLSIADQVQLDSITQPCSIATDVFVHWNNEYLHPSSSHVAVVHSLLLDLALVTWHQKILWVDQGIRFQSEIIEILSTTGSSVGHPRFYRVTEHTRIHFKKTPSLISTSYSQLSPLLGHDVLFQDLLACIQLSLSMPMPPSFTSFDQCQRGALLSGPTGTGKTFFVRHLLGRLETSLGTLALWIDACDSKEKIEKKLASPFSVLVLNDLDHVDPSMLPVLGTAMDRASFTLATCQQPHLVPTYLRKARRLDRDLEFHLFSLDQRVQFLMHHLPMVSSSDTRSLAESLNGYTPADLVRLLDVAKDIEDSKDWKERLERARKCVKPSLYESAVQVPVVKWSDIGGNDRIKQILREVVEWPTTRAEAFKNFGISPPKGILLYGPPGCSKTLIAKALANEANMHFLAVKGPELFSKWVGDSEKALKHVFQKARALAPSILFFDEIDAIATKRASESTHLSVLDRVIAQLLNELDGIEPLVQVTVVAATNRPDLLDPALMRPGRMDLKIYIGPPDHASIKAILYLQIKKIINCEEINLDEFATKLEGCSGAEVVQFCQDAAMNALERSLDDPKVTLQDFEAALKLVTRRITPSMLEFYDSYQKKQRSK